MIDKTTRERLSVSRDGTAGPYLMVPVEQVPRVRELLNKHGISFWVDSDAIALDGQPAIAVVNFGRHGEADQIQAILDDAD